MSPLGRGLLASALTLPLVAFVAGVLASPDPVDPDRSRPVIVGRVSDDSQPEKPTPAPRERQDDSDDRDDEQDDQQDDRTDDQPGTAVSPPPRYVDDGDDDGDDGGSDDDDDREDDTDDGGESDDD